MAPEDYAGVQQVLAGIWALRRSPRTAALLAQWFALAQDAQLITDAPSIAPNPPGFSDHRHDQAIFSLLVRLHNVTTIQTDPTFPVDHARAIGSPVAAARSRD